MTDADRLLREMAWYGCELLGWEPPSFDEVIYPAVERRTQPGGTRGGAVASSKVERIDRLERQGGRSVVARGASDGAQVGAREARRLSERGVGGVVAESLSPAGCAQKVGESDSRTPAVESPRSESRWRLSEGVTGWASLLAAATPADAPSESRCKRLPEREDESSQGARLARADAPGTTRTDSRSESRCGTTRGAGA